MINPFYNKKVLALTIQKTYMPVVSGYMGIKAPALILFRNNIWHVSGLGMSITLTYEKSKSILLEKLEDVTFVGISEYGLDVHAESLTL